MSDDAKAEAAERRISAYTYQEKGACYAHRAHGAPGLGQEAETEGRGSLGQSLCRLSARKARQDRVNSYGLASPNNAMGGEQS